MRSAFVSLLTIAAISGKVLAFDDIPDQCQSVCNSLGQAEDRCDDIFDDNEGNERACICSATGAGEAIPLCAACWNEAARTPNNDVDDDDIDDNEGVDLLRRCSLQALSTYNLASPSPSQTVVAAASVTSSTPTMTSGPSSTTTGSGTAVTTIVTTTQGNGNDDNDDNNASSTTTSIPNAGPTAGPANILAGAGLLLAAAML